MKKLLLFLLISVCGLMAHATKYEINVGGIEVTSDNSSNVTGGNITVTSGCSSGYVQYSKSSNTLTLHTITITRTGSSNYAIHNRKCDNLTIELSGSCKFKTEGPTFKIQRTTTIEADYSSSTTAETSGNYAVIDADDSNVSTLTFMGSGVLFCDNSSNSKSTLNCRGGTYFKGGKVTLQNRNGYGVSEQGLYFYNNTDLHINSNTQAINNCILSFNGSKVAILKPHLGSVVNNSSGLSTILDPSTNSYAKNVYISDNYVAINNSTYFPDANLRNALLSLGYAYINSTDVANRLVLNLSNKNISNLQGIEIFTELVDFDCSYNNVTSIPFTTYNKLKYLKCNNNKITQLMGGYNWISYFSVLVELDCSNNLLEGLNLPSYSTLTKVNASNNRFTSFSYNSQKKLTSLDLSNNPNLKTINCEWDALTTLKVANCPSLTYITCRGNSLTSLDLSGCTNLKELNCSDNKLTSINNLSSCASLEHLTCSGNQLTSLTGLSYTLKYLSCGENKLSGAFQLSGRNDLYFIGLSSNTGLTSVSVYNNSSLTDIYVNNCTSLTKLVCNNNKLNEIHYDNCPNLSELNLSNNQFTSIDVSSLSNLLSLVIDHNKLTSLNLSNNTKLKTLYANANQLTSLNVQGCAALTTAYCQDNKLSTVLFQGCNSLSYVNCCLNQIKESGMSTLVNSLRTIPSGSSGTLDAIITSNSAEGNVITSAQVQTARNKRWIPRKNVNGSWVEITTTNLKGDVNGDGKVNVTDVTTLVNMILGTIPKNEAVADINGDGKVNVSDVTALINIILGVS